VPYFIFEQGQEAVMPMAHEGPCLGVLTARYGPGAAMVCQPTYGAVVRHSPAWNDRDGDDVESR
jgi:hypothetical protein